MKFVYIIAAIVATVLVVFGLVSGCENKGDPMAGVGPGDIVVHPPRVHKL